MNSDLKLYSICHTFISDKGCIRSYGSPFVAVDDGEAVSMVSGTFRKMVKDGFSFDDLVPGRDLVCLGDFRPCSTRPIVLNKGVPLEIISCSDIYQKFVDYVQKEE